MKRQLIVLALTILVSAAAIEAQENNLFETRHSQGEAKNPPGLSMVLDTRDGNRTFSEGEYIPLVIRYSSDISYKYKVETGLGSNDAAESQQLYTDGQTAPLYCRMSHVGHGQQLQPLSPEPVIAPHCISFRLKPGKHELYATAKQVFPWNTGYENGKELLTTSNILWLDVTADPGWQQRALARIMRDFDKHSTASCRELMELDIPEATAEKLDLLDHGRCGRLLRFHPTEYETAQQTFEQWIRDPNHVVTDAAIDALASVRASVSRRETTGEWPEDPEKQASLAQLWLTAEQSARTALAQEICATLPTKSRAAQVSTKKNVCEVLRWQPPVKDPGCGCRHR